MYSHRSALYSVYKSGGEGHLWQLGSGFPGGCPPVGLLLENEADVLLALTSPHP